MKKIVCFKTTLIFLFVLSVTSSSGELSKSGASPWSFLDVRSSWGNDLPHSRSSYTTENVIILVIDGLRNKEAFEDPTHQYIPHLWNDLRPLGTIYTDFYTTAFTATTQGHLSLLTGARFNVEMTYGSTSDYYREHRPTIFEAYRKASESPMDKNWIVSGKDHLSTTDYSLHPFWGQGYRGSLEFDVGDDIETMQRFLQIASDDQPSLVMINLREVDETAHHARFVDYTDAIVRADSLAYALWEYIQADPYYRDRTTLIVTTDHGRFAGILFFSHGGPDHSNRHIPFLAIGPDIQGGLEVTNRGDLIDIAPTVAELLGFSMPFAEGRVLHEMLRSREDERSDVPPGTPSAGEVNLSNSSGASLYPSIDAKAGRLHLVWSERDSTSEEEQRTIYYSKSLDYGDLWDIPFPVVDRFTYYKENSGMFSEERGTPVYAMIRSGDGDTLFTAANGYSVGYSDPALEKKELRWGVNLFTGDMEGNWVEQGFDNRGNVIASAPSLAVGSGSTWVAWTEGIMNLAIGHSEPGTEILPRVPPLPYYPYGTPSMCLSENFLHMVLEIRNRWTFYGKYDITDLHFDSTTLLCSDGHVPSSGPRIIKANGIIYVVWADYYPDGWKVKIRRSFNEGTAFDEIVQLSASDVGAWNPDISVHDSVVVVVWEDYRHGNGEIYGIVSHDGGDTWGPEIRVTEADSFSSYPRVVNDTGNFFLVWQDFRDGNWEIYFKRFKGV